jgi:hypothetical protein
MRVWSPRDNNGTRGKRKRGIRILMVVQNTLSNGTDPTIALLINSMLPIPLSREQI